MNDQNSVAVQQQNRHVPPLVQFKRDMNALMERGEFSALPDSVSPEAFRNAAIVAFQDNPEIARCSPESVFRSLRKLAGMGLVPDSREAAIVPFRGQATAMPMVYGLYKLALNSGTVRTIRTVVVYEGEDFTLDYTTGEAVIRHDFDPFDRTGAFRGVYAVAKMADGRIEVETMGKKEIEKRRMASPTQNGPKPTGIWGQWYEEMSEKTVLKKLMKRLPMSPQDRRIIEQDDEPRMREVNPDQGRTNAAAHIRAVQPDAQPAEPESTIELDGDTIDSDTGEVLDAEPAQDHAPTEADVEQEPEVAFISPAQAQDVVNKIRKALDAGTDYAAVEKFFAEQLVSMQVHRPELYQAARTELDDAAAANRQ